MRLPSALRDLCPLRRGRSARVHTLWRGVSRLRILQGRRRVCEYERWREYLQEGIGYAVLADLLDCGGWHHIFRVPPLLRPRLDPFLLPAEAGDSHVPVHAADTWCEPRVQLACLPVFEKEPRLYRPHDPGVRQEAAKECQQRGQQCRGRGHRGWKAGRRAAATWFDNGWSGDRDRQAFRWGRAGPANKSGGPCGVQRPVAASSTCAGGGGAHASRARASGGGG
mmetsp:Transcript_44027/g.82302  ORF Transcript_44027/g.82302 Transcript_44027/m.82302 type:complete len:224 (-) Transcript_44027:64-735(-)